MTFDDFHRWSRTTQLAALSCAAAVLLDGGIAVTVLQRTRDHAVTVPAALQPLPELRGRALADEQSMYAALSRRPFDQPGAPASGPGMTLAMQLPAAPIRQPRLIGTVVEGQKGFVIVEMPDAHTQLVRIGEKAGELRLRSVSAGEAAFDDAKGNKVVLRAPVPGTERTP